MRLGENTLDTHDDMNFPPVNKPQPKPEVLEAKTDRVLNTQMLKGEYFGENDSDLEIDGENTIKANFVKRWDPLKGKICCLDSSQLNPISFRCSRCMLYKMLLILCL